MESRLITVLPESELRILKQIFIVTESRHKNDISIGYILYERKFAEGYTLKETPIEERDFKYYLEYPRQDSFPKDNVDDLILQSVRNSYPKSIVKNHSIVCNVDKEKIDLFRKRPVEKSFIKITPDFSNTDFRVLAGKQFKYAQKELNIYADYNLEEITNLSFFGSYNYNDNLILDKFNEVIFL
jgi:Mor family transcriptional regulator